MKPANPKRSFLKQQLWKVRHAQSCVAKVKSFCELYLEMKPGYPSPLYSSLVTAICVIYAKPFTNNDTVGMLSEKFGRFSDPELTRLHQELIDFRNKLYAHRHPDFLKIHIRVEVQDLGQMIKHDFYPDVEDSDFDFKRIPDIVRMCDELEPNLQSKRNELMDALFGKRHWPEGRFTLNLTDES